MIPVFCGLAAVIIAIMLFWRFSGVFRIRRYIIPFFGILFAASLILFSRQSVDAAGNGLALWAETVVPALFPFFVCAEIINSTGIARILGKILEPFMRPAFNAPGCASVALALGISSGYPVGAKITADLRTGGMIGKNEAERLLSFTNNSGPLFIVGAVGTGMLGSPETGMFLFACHFLASISVGIISGFFGRLSSLAETRPKMRTGMWPDLPKGMRPQRRSEVKSAQLRMLRRASKFYNTEKKDLSLHYAGTGTHAGFGALLGDAVGNAVATTLKIGGFIVLFSVIIRILGETGIIRLLASLAAGLLSPVGVDAATAEGIVSGIFEITSGARLISIVPGIPAAVRLPAVSFVIGWAGLSVHFQVMGIISRTDIRAWPYIGGKFLHGLLAAFYAWSGLKIFPGAVFAAANSSRLEPAFSRAAVAVTPPGAPASFLPLSICTGLVFAMLAMIMLYSVKKTGLTNAPIFLKCAGKHPARPTCKKRSPI